MAPRGQLALAMVLLYWCIVICTPRQALADVYVTTRNYNLDPLPALEANFGPSCPSDGVEGALRAASPGDACAPLEFPDFTTPWIALIARQQQFPTSLNCTFDIKVRHAQDAGAAAAIVYDDEYEALIIMSKPGNHPDPLIPSVFVSEKSGLLMLKLLTLEPEDGVHIRITPSSSVEWMSMLMSAMLGVLALTVVFSTIYLMRSWSLWLSGAAGLGGQLPGQLLPGLGGGGGGGGLRGSALDGGLPPEVLRALPVLIYEAPPASASSRARSGRRQPGRAAAQQLALCAGPWGGSQGAASLGHAGQQGTTTPDVYMDVEAAMEAAGVFDDEGSEGGSEVGDDRGAADMEEVGPVGSATGGAHTTPSSQDASSRASSELEGMAAPFPGVHAGETKHICTVCLENYVEGDKLRVLPCHHRFHMQCVDQWLSVRRLCPMCKHDAGQPVQVCSLGGTGTASAHGAQQSGDLTQPQAPPGVASPSATVVGAVLSSMRQAWVGQAPPPASPAVRGLTADAASSPPQQRRSPNVPAAAPGTLRARIQRWVGLRASQRVALLRALSPGLTEPLLPPPGQGGLGSRREQRQRDVEPGAAAVPTTGVGLPQLVAGSGSSGGTRSTLQPASPPIRLLQQGGARGRGPADAASPVVPRSTV